MDKKTPGSLNLIEGVMMCRDDDESTEVETEINDFYDDGAVVIKDSASTD